MYVCLRCLATAQVYLHSSEKELLSILNVEVKVQRSTVNRVLHFYQQKRSFLRKSFQLPSELGEGEGRGWGRGQRLWGDE